VFFMCVVVSTPSPTRMHGLKIAGKLYVVSCNNLIMIIVVSALSKSSIQLNMLLIICILSEKL